MSPWTGTLLTFPKRHNQKAMSKKTVIMFIASMGIGGAERVVSVMSNYWVQQGWRVILLSQKEANVDFYTLDERITRIGMGLLDESGGFKDAMIQNFKRLRFFRQVIRQYKPDVIISFLPPSNVLAIISAKSMNIPVIVSERSNPLQDPIKGIWRKGRKLTYKHANAVVIQTTGSLAWARDFIPENNISIIPNPVWAKFPATPAADNIELPQGTVIIAMGRLSEEKGYDQLIQAFSKVATQHKDAYLVILGDGDMRPTLEALIDELKLKNRVLLPGKVEKPHSIIEKADIIALSSRYEGFPNALLEGMSLGLAALSYNCPSGPSDLVDHEVSGLLIPPENVTEMAAGMDKLLSNPKLVQQMGEQAQKVKQRFAIEKVMGNWEALVHKVKN